MVVKKIPRNKSASPVATVLVVEDHLPSLEYLATLLRYRNYHVLEATNAVDGLKTALVFRPDLIITDVAMPDCDGYEFVRQLRADPAIQAIPIIFWTATYCERGSAVLLAEDLGVECVLSKPTEPEAILIAVERALALPAAHPRLASAEASREGHTRLLTNTVFEQVNRLQAANERLQVSDAQYRSLFHDNPVPMWIVDARFRKFINVNRAAEIQYGYSQREFLALPVTSLYPSEPPASRFATEGTPTGLIGASVVEVRHLTKSGQVMEVSLTRQAILVDTRPAWLEVAVDITIRKQAEEMFRDSEQQLLLLASRLHTAQDDERTRISRCLHDQLGQQLTALRMNSEWVLGSLPDTPVLQDKLRASLRVIDDLITLVQKLAVELRPAILDYGIAAAVETLVVDFAANSGIRCSVRVPEDVASLEPARAAGIYRILQECLANVARHSGAARLEVELKNVDSKLVLTVKDNGRGITTEQVSSRSTLGLLGMRERAAQIGAALSIQGGAGGGTAVELRVPLLSGPAAETTSFLENILQSSTQYSIVGVLPDLTIQLWNEGARRLYGYEPAEVIGVARISILDPPGEPPQKLAQIIEETLRTGQWEGQLVRVRKNGVHFLASVGINARRDQLGQHVGFLLISRDISEERKFQDLVESASEATVVVDNQGLMVLVNAQAEKLFGYERKSLLGRSVNMIVPGLSENAEAQAELELPALRRDGSKFPAEISMSPIETPEGALIRSLIRDITERKLSQQALQEKNDELSKANQAKDLFLASMSHELRTPLNAIIGFTGTLLMRLPGPLNPEQERQLRTVQNSGRQLLSLIDDLLDLTKIESGKVDLRPMTVNCTAILQEVAAVQGPAAEGKGLMVDVAVPEHPVIVMTDERAVRQILLNLASNAVKFTTEGRVTLEIRDFQTEVQFRVTDTGRGIAEKDKAHLFQAFSQVGVRREGTGLGLLLSRKLAELLGGTIRMESREGEGSMFCLTLPRP